MEKSEITLGLLEFISFKVGCMYLSDLHQPNLLPLIQHTIRGLSPRQFSLWEWNDAVQYITGKEGVFPDQEQAASYLLSYKTNQI